MTVYPERIKLNTSVSVPSSKSYLIRSLICSLFFARKTVINGKNECEDVLAAERCVAALGAQIEKSDGCLCVVSPDAYTDNAVFECGESAAVLRLLLPCVCACGINSRWVLGGRLNERNNGQLFKAFAENGVDVKFSCDGKTVETSGKLKKCRYYIDTSVSSQFASGFALACALNGSELELTGVQVSTPYFEMTLKVLENFGVEAVQNGNVYSFIHSRNEEIKINAPVDYSCAAFHLVAGALGKEPVSVNIPGADLYADEPDGCIVDILKKSNAKMKIAPDAITVYPSVIKPFEADISSCPDLAPVLAVLGVASGGECVLVNTARLKYKESDRVREICNLLNAFGSHACAGSDCICIDGSKKLKGGSITVNDHRIAMAAFVASLLCSEKVVIDGVQCIDKSYPEFIENFFAC